MRTIWDLKAYQIQVCPWDSTLELPTRLCIPSMRLPAQTAVSSCVERGQGSSQNKTCSAWGQGRVQAVGPLLGTRGRRKNRP